MIISGYSKVANSLKEYKEGNTEGEAYLYSTVAPNLKEKNGSKVVATNMTENDDNLITTNDYYKAGTGYR